MRSAVSTPKTPSEHIAHRLTVIHLAQRELASSALTFCKFVWPAGSTSSQTCPRGAAPHPASGVIRYDQIWCQSSCWAASLFAYKLAAMLVTAPHTVQQPTKFHTYTVPKTRPGHGVSQPSSHHKTNINAPSSFEFVAVRKRFHAAQSLICVIH